MSTSQVPQQPGQPTGQQPQQPAGPPVLTGAQLNMRIAHGDPNFPSELWGRTVGEAIRFYGVMKQDFMARNNPANQPALQGQPQGQSPQQPAQQPAAWPQQQPQQQPQRTYQPPTQPQFQQQPPAQPQQGFTTEDLVARMEDMVNRAVAPMRQASAQTVYQQVRAEFGDWGQYDQAIRESVGGAQPEALLNPDFWRSAYYFIKGRTLSQNPQQSQQPQVVTDPFALARQPNGAIVTPPPPPPTAYFSEAPGAPSPNGLPGQPIVDATDELMARRFQIPVEEYRAWKNGNVPAMAQPGQPMQQPQNPPMPQLQAPNSNGRWP